MKGPRMEASAASDFYLPFKSPALVGVCTRQNGHRDKFRCYSWFHDQGQSSDFENLTLKLYALLVLSTGCSETVVTHFFLHSLWC